MKKRFYFAGGIMLAVFVILFILSLVLGWDAAIFPAGIMAAAVIVAFIGSARKKNY